MIDDIKKMIQKALYDLYGDKAKNIPIVVEIPKNSKHGDFSTNVAMLLGRKNKKEAI